MLYENNRIDNDCYKLPNGMFIKAEYYFSSNVLMGFDIKINNLLSSGCLVGKIRDDRYMIKSTIIGESGWKIIGKMSNLFSTE